MVGEFDIVRVGSGGGCGLWWGLVGVGLVWGCAGMRGVLWTYDR